MNQSIQLCGVVAPSQNGVRLDQALVALFSDYSRSRLQSWVQQGWITIDGKVAQRAKEKVFTGEEIVVQAMLTEAVKNVPQALPLDILFEDESLIIINKPAGFVVHPGNGVPDGTILNAVLHHCPQLTQVPRAGIIHRLDKDTTGLMVIAKTLTVQARLVEMLQARKITREYEAIVYGRMTAGGKVNAPIGRHPRQRTHMAVVHDGKPAVTHYRVSEKFRAHTRLRLRLETGRTHQIRVHMAHIRYPLLGDPVYAGRFRLLPGASETLAGTLRGFSRQALHATLLAFNHPQTGVMMQWRAPVPEDMAQLCQQLREDTCQYAGEYV